MLYDSDRVFRIFLGGIQSRFCFRSAPAVKQVFPDTIGSIGDWHEEPHNHRAGRPGWHHDSARAGLHFADRHGPTPH